MKMIRTLMLLLVAGTPAALSGCFLFSGSDDDKDKGSGTAAMDASGAPHAEAVHSAAASPWRSMELKDDGGSSGGGLLPIAAIVLAVVSLGLVIVHQILHRRRRVAPPV